MQIWRTTGWLITHLTLITCLMIRLILILIVQFLYGLKLTFMQFLVWSTVQDFNLKMSKRLCQLSKIYLYCFFILVFPISVAIAALFWLFDGQGNTAVYLLYAHARICSIIRKSGKDVDELKWVSSLLLFLLELVVTDSLKLLCSMHSCSLRLCLAPSWLFLW